MNVTVAILMACIDSLPILGSMPRLSGILMRLASLALASERTLLCRRVPWASVHGASFVLVNLVLLVVVAFLSLEALEVGVLARTNLVLLEVGKHCLLGHFLGVAVDVSLAMLVLIRCLIYSIHQMALAVDHVIVIVLGNLLVAVHYLVKFHLTV